MEGKVVQQLVREHAPHEAGGDLAHLREHEGVELLHRPATGAAPLHRHVVRDRLDGGGEELQDLAGERAVARPGLHHPEGIGLVEKLEESLHLPRYQHPERGGHVRSGHEVAPFPHRRPGVETFLRIIEGCLHELGERDRPFGADAVLEPLRERWRHRRPFVPVGHLLGHPSLPSACLT